MIFSMWGGNREITCDDRFCLEFINGQNMNFIQFFFRKECRGDGANRTTFLGNKKFYLVVIQLLLQRLPLKQNVIPGLGHGIFC